MLVKQEPRNSRNTKTPPSLQEQAARALVNSEEWAAKLDHFSQNSKWTKDPALYESINQLLKRTPSESELNDIVFVISERFTYLKKIQKIRVAFSVPEDELISIVLTKHNRVDVSKTLEPLKKYFSPNLTKTECFKFIVELNYTDIIKAWLKLASCVENIDLEYFNDNILEIFYVAIKANSSYLDDIMLPSCILEDISVQEFYQYLFLRLNDEKASYSAINHIWCCINPNRKMHVLRESFAQRKNLDLLWSYILIVFPEDWQDHEIYLDTYYMLFLGASLKPGQYWKLLCDLANLVEHDLGILHEALYRSFKFSPNTFRLIVNIYIIHLPSGWMSSFINENLFLFFEQVVNDNNSNIFQEIWDRLIESQILEARKWLNESDSYYLCNEEMADIVLPKLSGENQQKVIIRSISYNLDDYFLVFYLFSKLDDLSKEVVKQNCDKDKPDLYDRYWYDYLKEPGLKNKIDDILKSIKFMFGSDYAQEYAKYFVPITTMNRLLRNAIPDFKQEWQALSHETKAQFFGPIIYCLFHEFKNEDCHIIDFLMGSISSHSAQLIEKEIQKRVKLVAAKFAFAYWVEKHASAEFIANLDSDDIDSLVGFEDNNMPFTYKVLDALYQYNRLDRLELNKPINYTNLITCGGDLLFLPYLIKGLLSVHPINFDQQIAMDVFSMLCSSLGGKSSNPSLNRAIRIYASSICSFINNPNKKSIAKLDYFSSAMIKSNKKSPEDKVQAFLLLVTGLLSDRKTNPLLEGDKQSKPGFFKTKNPIDGLVCRSESEKNMITLFNELKNQYPEKLVLENLSLEKIFLQSN